MPNEPRRPVIHPGDHDSAFGDPSYPARPTEPGLYTVQGLWRVVEWRGSAVFRTAFIRNCWVPVETKFSTWVDDDTSFMLVSISTFQVEKWNKEGRPTVIRVHN